MADPAYPGFAASMEAEPQFRQRLSRFLNNLLTGKINVGGTVTLTADATSTTLTDPRITYASNIILTPTTADAAAELAGGTLYISEADRMNGSVVITHANDASEERTFRYSILG
jgi:hypothetical protein